jgi:hypothetical protein
MAMHTTLRIALFEENPRLFALLSALLVQAGQSVSKCSKDDYPLATFLKELVEELRPPSIPYYDLCIIDLAETSPSYEILTPLEHLIREQAVPIILLTETDNPTIELLKIKVAIVPVLFHTILRMQDVFSAIETTMGMSIPLSVPQLREVQQQQLQHFQTTIQAEQAWMAIRRTWLNQREEWLTQRQQWLTQRMLWILQQRELPDAQCEWLDEQRDWLAQQQEEVKQQQRWVQHHRVFLDQRQRRLDQLIRQQPLADVG